jgi:hypothetical protein
MSSEEIEVGDEEDSGEESLLLGCRGVDVGIALLILGSKGVGRDRRISETSRSKELARAN